MAGRGQEGAAGGGSYGDPTVWGAAVHAGHLAGHLHGLGPSTVPSGTRVGGDVQAGTLTGVGAAAGALAGVGAAAAALQGCGAGARGRAGPHQTGHAGRGHWGEKREPLGLEER